MRPVVFAAEYHPPFAPGGAEWSNAAWARALARRSQPVVVVTPNYGAARREEQDGVTIERVPFPVKLRAGQGEAPWLVHRNPLFHAYFAWHVRRVARRTRARIIHAQGKGAIVAAWLAGRALSLPVVATIRDAGYICPLGFCTLFEPWETFDCSTAQYARKCVPFFLRHYHGNAGALRRLRLRASLAAAWVDQKLRHAALARVDRIIGVSRGILAIHPARLVDPRRARVVHTLPPVVTPPTESEVAAVRSAVGIPAGPLVLYAGKLSLGKGTGVFIDALDDVRAAVPGVRFALAGKGAWDVPRAADVHVLGSLPQRELFALYRAADVVVVPSVWPEPLSRVLLEAMRLGRPVVATDVGGTPEAVQDGTTGLLVPRDDPKSLARAVVALLGDPARRERMGAAAARRADEVFDEERLVDTLLDVYRTATG